MGDRLARKINLASRVDARRCLLGKLIKVLSSMISNHWWLGTRLNVTNVHGFTCTVCSQIDKIHTNLETQKYLDISPVFIVLQNEIVYVLLFLFVVLYLLSLFFVEGEGGGGDLYRDCGSSCQWTCTALQFKYLLWASRGQHSEIQKWLDGSLSQWYMPQEYRLVTWSPLI